MRSGGVMIWGSVLLHRPFLVLKVENRFLSFGLVWIFIA